VLLLVWFVAYWGGMAGLIWLDAERQRAAARAAGAVDFIDRRIWPYMVMGLICGPLPLIFYFGTTRKSAAGWAIGIGAGVGWSILFSILYGLIDAYARATTLH
jgi:hypothetical protein